MFLRGEPSPRLCAWSTDPMSSASVFSSLQPPVFRLCDGACKTLSPPPRRPGLWAVLGSRELQEGSTHMGVVTEQASSLWATRGPGSTHKPQHHGDSGRHSWRARPWGRAGPQRQGEVSSPGRGGRVSGYSGCCSLPEAGPRLTDERLFGDLRPQPLTHPRCSLHLQHPLACWSLPYCDCYSTSLQPQGLRAGKMVDG